MWHSFLRSYSHNAFCVRTQAQRPLLRRCSRSGTGKSNMTPFSCASGSFQQHGGRRRSVQASCRHWPDTPFLSADSRSSEIRHIAMTVPAHTAPCRSRTGTDISARLVGMLCIHRALSSDQTSGRFEAAVLFSDTIS